MTTCEKILLFVVVGLVVGSMAGLALGADGGVDGGTPEMCNLIDDDLDGETDEYEDLNFGVVCDWSVFSPPVNPYCNGVEYCWEGEWLCSGPVPEPESCDGKDNDCDGQTDEDPDELCPGDETCALGYCAEPCVDLEPLCPTPLICEEVDGEWLCISDACNPLNDDHLPCAENPNCCDEGNSPPCHCEPMPMRCVDGCDGVTCPIGFVCVPADNGECHFGGQSCYVDGCGDGQHCVDDECTDDPCAGVDCDEGDYCNLDGDCVSPCMVDACPSGCFDGECVDDPCAGVLCEPGWSCEDGECVQGDCWQVECDYYEVCVDGECIIDRCWNVKCPNCFRCLNGACYDPEFEIVEPDTDVDTDVDSDTDTDADNDSDTSTSTEPTGMQSVLATGGGGCMCGVGPGSGASLMGLVLGLVVGR